MMVYPEEPSIWAIPHIPALYDDDGDYGGKKSFMKIYQIVGIEMRSLKNHCWMNYLA